MCWSRRAGFALGPGDAGLHVSVVIEQPDHAAECAGHGLVVVS
jgi:hypothetical protein